MDFKDLIGLDVTDAKKVLNNFGYNDIEEVIKNVDHNELCDSFLVCLAKENNGKVSLFCGEFYLDIKR